MSRPLITPATKHPPDFAAVRATLAVPAVFDGRNLYDPAVAEEAGLAYYGIGRGRSLQAAR